MNTPKNAQVDPQRRAYSLTDVAVDFAAANSLIICFKGHGGHHGGRRGRIQDALEGLPQSSDVFNVQLMRLLSQ